MKEYRVEFHFIGGSSKIVIIQSESEEALKQEISSHEGWYEFKEVLSSKRRVKVAVKLETLTYFSIQEYRRAAVPSRSILNK
ncbi:hypothetical protein FZC66_10110 [Priestia megaterium]|nr:hypothetical protein FZC66_10110 [Priestia megaterium]